MSRRLTYAHGEEADLKVLTEIYLQPLVWGWPNRAMGMIMLSAVGRVGGVRSMRTWIPPI
jgi:hypothetical protein